MDVYFWRHTVNLCIYHGCTIWVGKVGSVSLSLSSFADSTDSLDSRSHFLASSLDGIKCPHRVDESNFLLVGQHCHHQLKL